MTQSLHAIKMDGIICIIGLLTGAYPKDNIMEVLSRVCTIRGVYVGSREQMEDMVKAMEEHNIHPVVDEKVFTLEHAKEAYEYLVSVLWTELSTNSC
jgi:D-arabinose 1-dehydrogenase-like Zn-dependent alcohol dehydrogenase